MRDPKSSLVDLILLGLFWIQLYREIGSNVYGLSTELDTDSEMEIKHG